MNHSHASHRLIVALAVSIAVSYVVATRSAGDESPEKRAAEKPNQNVPADDLAGELRGIAARLDGLLVKAEDYDEARQSRIAKEADVAAVVALALALDKQDHSLKRSASSALAASQALAKASDYAAAKRALDELKAAAEGKAATDSAGAEGMDARRAARSLDEGSAASQQPPEAGGPRGAIQEPSEIFGRRLGSAGSNCRRSGH